MFIPKSQNPINPGDFRPITISSVILRCLYKILAKRFDQLIELDSRQRAFRRMDGCASIIYLLDLALRYHQLRPIFVAILDIAKAFDFVSHPCIEAVLLHKGVPKTFVNYVMFNYKHLVMDGLLNSPPQEAGAYIDGSKCNAAPLPATWYSWPLWYRACKHCST